MTAQNTFDRSQTDVTGKGITTLYDGVNRTGVVPLSDDIENYDVIHITSFATLWVEHATIPVRSLLRANDTNYRIWLPMEATSAQIYISRASGNEIEVVAENGTGLGVVEVYGINY